MTFIAPSPIGASGVCRLLALTTRSSGTVRCTSIFSASNGDGVAGSPPRAAASGFVRYSVWLGRVRRVGGLREDLVEIDRAGLDAQLAFDARRPQLAAQLQVAVDPDVAHLVVDDLEVARGDVQQQGAELLLVHREVAGDREGVLMVVEHRDVVDVDLVGLQIDACRAGSCR